MITYLARRFTQAVLVMLATYTLAFVILYVLSGDPAITMLTAKAGDISNLSEADIEAVRQEYGFDRPLVVQYLDSLGKMLTGDWSTSYSQGRPVLDLLLTAVPSTVQLAVPAFVMSMALGSGIAILATYTRSAALRSALLALPPLAVSVPTFWVGLTMLQWFSFKLAIFPAAGDQKWSAVVLPALTLTIFTSAGVAQVLTKSLMRTMDEPFIATARAKGASRWRILSRHALRNSAIPALTVAGVAAGNLLTGSIVTESVFSRNGLGRVTVQAVTVQDVPLVLGVVVFIAAGCVLFNLVIDALYPIFDPRIAAGGPSPRGAAPAEVTA